jgi:hypothetical protein
MTESEIKPGRVRWRWGILVAVAMTLIALFPQIHFVVNRGHEWHGANAITHPDEVAYSAYVASLIRGNPRRYDPYTGREDQREGQRDGQQDGSSPESLFSIQFVPAYAVALPSRWLGLSASTVFMILPALCAFASSLIIFWLLWLLTGDERFSAASVPIILGFGTLIAGQGIARHVPNLNYLIPLWISKSVSPPSLYHLPFLRLYQPAVAFPLFFALCALVWLALTRASRQQSVVAATGAGLLFALLIFSYFYLWTAAAAWLACVCALWVTFRKSERKRAIIVFGLVSVVAAVALVPYFTMLSRRAATVDAAQALVFTHGPDFFRFPEIVSLLVLLMIGAGAWRRIFEWRDPLMLLAASFALSVLVVFNQQIITGRSLQPIHYQWFIANYCTLVALVLTVALWWRRSGTRLRFPDRRLMLIAIAALVWAFAEVWLAASVSFDYNRGIDEGKPVADRLSQLAPVGGAPTAAPLVLMADLKLADRLPTDAPEAVLWAPRMLVFPAVSEAENRERFWQQLYYLGYDEKKFWAALDHADWNFYVGMFPYYRLSPVVSGSNAPITPEEIRAQVVSYLDYARTFNRNRAATPSLSYLVVHADNPPEYANIDRWYQRDAGERVGSFILYRLKLRE